MSRRVVAVCAAGALLLATAVTLGVHAWGSREPIRLEEAASFAPADAERLLWTDWAAVRSEVDADVSASSSASAVSDFLDDAYDRDLTSASALVESAPALQAHFGFSPASVSWELFSQSEDGAVVILRLPDSISLDDVGDRLAASGFTRPATADGVWEGGQQLLPGIAADLTPELQYVALDADHHLVLTSDQSPYLARVVSSLGDAALPAPVSEVVSASGSPLSAVVYDSDYVCSALAMAHADRDDQAAADRLVADAGEVDPLTAYAMSLQPSGEVRVAMGFASDAQARDNADSRAALAAGPAPGQGGSFRDRFSVTSATASGRLVTLSLHPRAGTYVLSDLSSGPVLFATC